MADLYGSSKKDQIERRRKYLSFILGPEKDWSQEDDPEFEIEQSKEIETFPWEEEEEEEEEAPQAASHTDLEIDEIMAALRADMGDASDMLLGSMPSDEPIEVGETPKPQPKPKPPAGSDIEVIDDDPMEDILRIARLITEDPRVLNETSKSRRKFIEKILNVGRDDDEDLLSKLNKLLNPHGNEEPIPTIEAALEMIEGFIDHIANALPDQSTGNFKWIFRRMLKNDPEDIGLARFYFYDPKFFTGPLIEKYAALQAQRSVDRDLYIANGR